VTPLIINVKVFKAKKMEGLRVEEANRVSREYFFEGGIC